MKTLKIEELSKNFGSTEVLRKINLEIDEGNFLVLLGPSGCGKSTLLNKLSLSKHKEKYLIGTGLNSLGETINLMRVANSLNFNSFLIMPPKKM